MNGKKIPKNVVKSNEKDSITYQGIPYHAENEALVLQNLGITRITDLKGLKYLNEVEILDLRENQIEKLEGLENLTRLKELRLTMNCIGRIEGLENLRNLEGLDLGGNKIEKIEGLETLKLLDRLELQWNKIARIEGLASFENLVELSIGHNPIKTIENLDCLEKLEYLYLPNCEIRFLREIGTLEKLLYLEVQGNRISEIDPSIGDLKNLKEIYLGDNQLDDIPPAVRKLDGLKILDLTGNPLGNLSEDSNDYLKRLIDNHCKVTIDPRFHEIQKYIQKFREASKRSGEITVDNVFDGFPKLYVWYNLGEIHKFMNVEPSDQEKSDEIVTVLKQMVNRCLIEHKRENSEEFWRKRFH